MFHKNFILALFRQLCYECFIKSLEHWQIRKVRILLKNEIQPMLYLKVTYATAALKLIVTPSLSVHYGITWVVKFPSKG